MSSMAPKTGHKLDKQDTDAAIQYARSAPSTQNAAENPILEKRLANGSCCVNPTKTRHIGKQRRGQTGHRLHQTEKGT